MVCLSNMVISLVRFVCCSLDHDDIVPGQEITMSDSASFGDWIRRRRRALDLTREALAQQVGCAVVTIRKIETDERRPSRQVAERLADCLQVSADQRAAFLKAARAE